MKLTNKCKEDFLKSIYYKEDTNQVSIEDECNETIFNESERWLRHQDERFLNTLLIEFFDSAGYTLDRDSYNRTMTITDWTDGLENQIEIDCTYIEDFQDWWEEAIIKANEIYNEK